MNVIVIQIDSLNAHFLTCYGNNWVQAPNLTRFAEKAAVFDGHYVGSLPCMPARREIWTGTEEFWWRSWGPLEPWDQTVAFRARSADVTSALITDHYHFFEWGSHTFFADFDGYTFIRGHELDNWRTKPVHTVPAWAERMVATIGDKAMPYLRNVQDFADEVDFFGPQVMREAAAWLDDNHTTDNFYLHVDCFDVHEPFHIPEPYRSLYTNADHRQFNPWPIYGRTDSGEAALSSEEIEWVRAQFAGKLTMVDTWFGEVLDRLERYNLYDNTCVIVTTDHGHYLGEQNWMGKPYAPMYDTLTHIPLLIWHPSGVHNGKRVDTLTQTIDLYATLLDLLGASPADGVPTHSGSLLPLLIGEREEHRSYTIYGYNNRMVGITDGDWTLLRDHDPDAAEAVVYTQQVEHMNGIGWWVRRERQTTYPDLQSAHIHAIDTPVWRKPQPTPHIKRPDLLFDLRNDPDQTQNAAVAHPDQVNRLEEILRTHMRAMHVPDEQYARLGLGT